MRFILESALCYYAKATAFYQRGKTPDDGVIFVSANLIGDAAGDDRPRMISIADKLDLMLSKRDSDEAAASAQP